MTATLRRYVVVGCGAVGGLYGGRLADAGHDVTFVVRSGADALRSDGLRIDSVDGDLHLPPDRFGVVTDVADAGVPDVAVLAVKTTATVALGPLVGPDTTLVVLQNGLGVEEDADQRSGRRAGAVVGGMCFVCATLVEPGHVRHDDFGLVTLAAHRGGLAAAEAVARDLAGAHVPVEVSPDLQAARWRKLLWNVPFNGLTALLGVGTDRLLADPDGRALVGSIMDEVLAAGRADGADIGPEDAETMLRRTEAMVPYLSSMGHDRAVGRPLEHEAIHGAVVRVAAAHGVPTPLVEALHRALCVVSG